MKFIAPIVVLLGFVFAIEAQNCNHVVQRHAVNAHVNQAVVVTQFVPLVIDPRLSFLYYGNNVVQQPQPQPAPVPFEKPPEADIPKAKLDKMDLILSRLDTFAERLDRLEGKPAEFTPPGLKTFKAPLQESKRNYAEVLNQYCAACHTAGNLNNNRFVIFGADGQLDKNWNAKAVYTAIAEARMPPKNHKGIAVPQIDPEGRRILDETFTKR